MNVLPFLNLAGGEIGHHLRDFVGFTDNDNGEGTTGRSWDGASTECPVFRFAGFTECEAVEFNRLGVGIISNDLCRLGDFLDRKLI